MTLSHVSPWVRSDLSCDWLMIDRCRRQNKEDVCGNISMIVCWYILMLIVIDSCWILLDFVGFLLFSNNAYGVRVKAPYASIVCSPPSLIISLPHLLLIYFNKIPPREPHLKFSISPRVSLSQEYGVSLLYPSLFVTAKINIKTCHIGRPNTKHTTIGSVRCYRFPFVTQ